MVFDEFNDRPARHNPQQENDTEVDSVENFGGSPRRSFYVSSYRARGASDRQLYDLYPRGRAPSRKFSREIELFGLFAAEFSARCFGNASGRDDFDLVWWQAEPLRNLLRYDRCNSGAARRFAFARFRDDDQLFRSRGLIFHAKRDDASFANAFRARRKFFDFVRVKIAAALDDDVLHAASDVNLAIGAV